MMRRCLYCKKALRSVVSVKFGYGPSCAKKLGVPYYMQAREQKVRRRFAKPGHGSRPLFEEHDEALMRSTP